MQHNRERIAYSWLKASRMDAAVARDLMDRLPPPSCFHSQQSVEKALKAVLVMLAGDAPRTHVINFLVEEIEAFNVVIPQDLKTDVVVLDQFYLPTRYPDALGGGDAMATYSTRQAREALAAAEAIILWSDEECARLKTQE